MATRRSDTTLKRYYRLYNRRYWGGKLPDDVVVRYRTPGDFRRSDIIQPAKAAYASTYMTTPPEILFDSALRRSPLTLRFTLHHEMVHIALRNRDNHGPAFERQMLRLATAGAFSKRRNRGKILW